jgi:hypothetical protein
MTRLIDRINPRWHDVRQQSSVLGPKLVFSFSASCTGQLVSNSSAISRNKDRASTCMRPWPLAVTGRMLGSWLSAKPFIACYLDFLSIRAVKT